MPSRMFIAGEWTDAHSGKSTPISSPYDGKTVDTVPLGARDDVRAAIDAARDAFDKGPWPRLPPRARGEVYLKAAKILTERTAEIAALESRNQGKTIKQAADAD